ncbi:MAG TPA: TrkA family potassium uptake protein [Saccharofermentans sp.]|nr:TrkA family potassium uptake protein [Saccharofermentans sp.]
MKIVIVGAGKVGYYLTKELLKKGHKVVVIDTREKAAAQIANDLNTDSICGDGSTNQVLSQACDNANVFVALTGKDEVNVIACQLAKKYFSVPLTIARVNNPRNNEIVNYFGVDRHYCSTNMFVDLVDNEIEYEGMRIVTRLNSTSHIIVEFKLSEYSSACGKTLAEYKFVKDSKVVIITTSEGKIITPQGDTIMNANDVILLVCPNSAIESVWKEMVKPKHVS